ncbi:hypothetical protein KSP39_PZI020336 [Platanthera zijinensis]|uniref:PUM-HD domain-containing protein n=1 Tax=Platanthera zijinensis TaxID=2320716 RepID=A0AAP0FWY1_9ASPA
MYKTFGEISNSASHNPSVGCISINGHGRPGYRLPFYANLEGIYECRFTETLPSSSSSLTSGEDDLRLFSPELDSYSPVPEMMLEELGLLEKLHLLQIQENKTKIRLSPADAAAADPYSSNGGGAPFLRNPYEGRTLPVGYSIDWIGDRPGFSTDAMLAESPPLHRINALRFNPTLGLIGNEISVNPLNNNNNNSDLHVKMMVYNLARNQEGCIYLQKKMEEGRADAVELIFCGVIEHAVELMENTFGNYLMQKLLDVCSLQQRMAIVLLVTESPLELIRISQNTHGTRAVQKLIEKIKTRQEILLVTAALGSGVLRLIKDINGNHVVQMCLLSLEPEENKFIFDAAARHCVEIATHQHGCCVLQCCISRSTGDHYTKLIYEISTNGLLLARDPFGNYVVQFILDLANPAANEILKSQFKGHFVDLSMQKFGSNVVEKCLQVFNHNERAKIVSELLHRDVFEQLVQDPFANYVIQSALAYTKGSPLHVSLVQAIRHLAPKLKATLHCRRILSRVLKSRR